MGARLVFLFQKHLLNSKLNILLLFSVVFLLQCFYSVSQKSMGWDEPKHLSSGLVYATYGDLSYGRDSTPVTALSALPLLFLDTRAIDFFQPMPDYLRVYHEPEHYQPWNAGHHFLKVNRRHYDTFIVLAKLPFILLGLLLGFYVFFWADLFSRKGAVFAVFFYCFSPNILAHSRFIGTDLALALGLVASLFHFQQLLSGRTMGRLAAFIAAVSFCFIAKLNAPIYLMLVLLPLAIYFLIKKKYQPVAYVAGGLLAGLLVLNLFSGFAGTFNSLKKGKWQSATMQGLSTMPLLKSLPLPLPQSYVNAIDYTLKIKPENTHYKFLFGAFSRDGWWFYFLLATLVKVTLPTIILLLLLAFLRPRAGRLQLYLLLAPVVLVYAFPSFFYQLNIGYRYVLAALPFFFILIGMLWQLEARWLRRTLLGLGAWHLLASLLIAPSYSSFFNLSIGGPKNGHRYLLNSNLGWGENTREANRYRRQYRPQRPDPFKKSNGHFMILAEKLMHSDRYPFGPIPGWYDWLKLIEPTDHIGYEYLIYKIE